MAPYVGEIRMFAGNFPPAGWLFCDGRLLPISEYETLFNLIDTTYGGDGESTFALPDLRGRIPVHQGAGPGVTNVIGETFGVEQVQLTVQQMPAHTHPFLASTAPGATTNPEGNVVAAPPSVTMFLRDAPATNLPAPMVQPIGGSQPHENRMPVLVINHIISLFGVFPSFT